DVGLANPIKEIVHPTRLGGKMWEWLRICESGHEDPLYEHDIVGSVGGVFADRAVEVEYVWDLRRVWTGFHPCFRAVHFVSHLAPPASPDEARLPLCASTVPGPRMQPTAPVIDMFRSLALRRSLAPKGSRSGRYARSAGGCGCYLGNTSAGARGD